MKFAGRTDSRGARFLHGRARNGARGRDRLAGVLIAAAVAVGVLCLLVAFSRSLLGAPPTVGFWPTFFALPLAMARLAHRAAFESGLLMAGGVLVLAALWKLCASFFVRRALDPVFCGLLVFQLFLVCRFGGALLPAAGPLTWQALALGQKINVALAALVFALLLVAWCGRVAPVGNSASAPSRITGFLKKRRMPLRIAGVVLMFIAAVATFLVGARLFDLLPAGAPLTTRSAPSEMEPAWFLVGFVLADIVYAFGYRFWRRVH